MILKSIAAVLIENGLGVTELNQFARRAFLGAAKHLEKRTGRRLSKARIAALTGMTRAEVTRLLRERGTLTPELGSVTGRAGRVVSAWLSDKKYCGPNNKAKLLPFYGEKRSFSSLVKEYGGDIPPRAMLAELQRLEVAVPQGRDKVELIRPGRQIDHETLTLLSAIADWLEFLTSASLDPSRKLAVNASEVSLSFASLSQAKAATRELDSRYAAFLRGVRELTGKRTVARKHVATINFALATVIPRAISRTTR